MDTVSYLTINDETKEIADIASRENIENIAATIAAQSDDLEYIQLATGPSGPISNAINQAYTTAFAAQSAAAASIEAAAIADEKATSAETAAQTAWDHADDAATAASAAWDRAGDAADAAAQANSLAEEAASSANVAQLNASSATQAASSAWTKASEAADAAALADQKAVAAGTSAQQAHSSAVQANNYANNALLGLSTLESVVDTVNWFADHRTLTTDTVVNNNKNYYSFDQSTGTMSKVSPWGGENPNAEGWYEIDETIQNYIVSHVAETDDGLYILSTAAGWRILISTGDGNYSPGIFIVSPDGTIKQAIRNNTLDGSGGISFDSDAPFSIGDEDAYLVFDGNGHIILGGEGIEMYAPLSIGEGRKTLSEVLDELRAAITSIEYGLSDSPDTHTSVVEWSSVTPEWQAGKYIWMRTSTNGLTYTYTCIQGAEGPQGPQGPQGEPGPIGNSGIGIISVEVSYAISPSAEITPRDDEWKSYLNQWYEVEEGETGITGQTGIIDETGSTGETGWTSGDFEEIDGDDDVDNMLLTIPPGSWLWVRTETIYSDYTSSVSYQKSYVGTDGQDGKSVFVQSSSKQNGVTTIVLADSDGNTETITINDGEDGATGIPGQPGQDGRTFYTHFAWADNIVIDDSTTPPTVTATGFDREDSVDKEYIGVYSDENIADSTNPNDYSWTLIKGADGTSVTITSIKYAVNNDGTTQPALFPYTTMPTVNKGQWLWVETTYSDNNVAITKSYMGTDGEDGTSVVIQSASKQNGITTIVLADTDGNTETLTINDGEDGATGTSGLNGYIHTAWATAADGSTGFSTSVSAGKTYLGVYTDNTATDSQTYSDYSWSLIKGEKGDPGTAAYSYQLLCNPSAIAKISTSATPATITFTSKRSQGTGVPVNYDCRFVIATSVDGVNWTTQATSAADEATKSYTAPASAKFVRCQMYAAGGTTTLLDTQTVPIISDGAKGEQGDDGKILNIHPGLYAESNLPAIGTVDDADAYLVDDGDGQYDLYYKGTGATGWTVVEDWQGVEGPKGDTGDKGDKGDTGKGISSITEEYARNNSASTAPSSGWGSTVLAPTANEKYVWNRETMNYTDNTSSSPTIPHIIAVYGETGNTGRGITSVVDYYKATNSTTAPADSAFSTTIDTPTSVNRYLWNYEIITYTSGEPEKTDKRIIGVYGETGATGDTGDDGEDAYTLILTNENHSFAATPEHAIAASTTCNIIAYKGTTQVAASIGTITGQISGKLTATISNNNTTSAYFTVAASATLTDKSGELTIPITVDGKAFTKKFSWTLSPEGEKGETGDTGVSVTNITSTNSTASGGTSVVTVTLSDGTSKTFNVKNGVDGQTPTITTNAITNGYQILVNGFVVATVNDGSDGHSPMVTTNAITGGYQILVDGSVVATVMDGAPGLNSATVYLYKRADSASKPSSGTSTYTFSTGQLTNVPSGWSQTFPAETQGNTTPVWMMCATASATTASDTISYSEWTTPVKMVSSGSNGTNGSNGVDGYNTATVYLYQKTNNTPSKPSNQLGYTFSSHSITSGTINNGWSITIPSTGTAPIWVTAATVVGKNTTQTIETTSWSDPVKLAENGTGVTVTSNITKYVASTSGTVTPESGWQDSIPTVAQGSYLWTRVVTTFSDSTSATSYTVSRQGVNGTNGTNGTSVTVTNTEYSYQLSTSGTTPPTGTWQTTPQAPTTTEYAWTKTVVTYSDNSEATTYTVGGKAGTNGTSSYTYIRYGTNSSGANMTTTPTASTTYIGVYVGTSSTAPTAASSYTWSKYVGDKGDTGDTGATGATGATGPEAVVTIVPSNINWDNNTATLRVVLRVNGTITTPTSYNWTKGSSTTSLGISSTLALDGTNNKLDSTYNCTVTW